MAQLTQREREVVSLLMQGKRRGEIAAELCITRRTVKAHLDNARCKADAKTAVELATKVARDGG
jgi:DNA-binding CsgD family transcriptional regulator